MKTFDVDVEIYLISYRISAKNKAEARRKAKEKIKKGIASRYIQNITVNEY